MKINGAYKFFEDNNEKFISSSKKFQDGRKFEKEQKIIEFAPLEVVQCSPAYAKLAKGPLLF